jgi:hypothetical protein
METLMELDELKQAWQTLDRRLQQQNTLHHAILHEQKTGRIRSSLRPLFRGQVAQAAFGIAAALAGAWIWRHLPALPMVIACSLLLLAYGVATTIAAGVVLEGIAGIDRSLPVLELQRRLAKLRRAYIVGGLVAGLPWWVLWAVPPVILLSLHAHATGSASLPAAAWGWFASGAIGLVATLAFLRWARRPGRELLAKRLDDAAAGSSLRRAQAELDALARFAEE